LLHQGDSGETQEFVAAPGRGRWRPGECPQDSNESAWANTLLERHLSQKRSEGSSLPEKPNPGCRAGDVEWDALLKVARREPICNQLILLLAYGCTLRRSKLTALEIRDQALPLQQITLRLEITKNGCGRVVMFGDISRELLQWYPDERVEADIHR
jgi:site-specific recombinase XerC